MSVVAMKKLSLFCSKRDSDEIISKLTKLRCVEMHRSELGEELSPCVFSDAKAEHEALIGKVTAAIAALSQYEKKKFSLVKRKIDVDFDAFVADGSYGSALEAVKLYEELLHDKKQYTAELSVAEECLTELSPWADSDIPLGFCGTERTFLVRGALPATVDLDQVARMAEEHYAVVERVSADAFGVYVTVIGLREHENEIMRALVPFGFTKSASYDAEDETAAGVMFEAEKKRDFAKAKLSMIERKMAELSKSINSLKVLCDIEKTELEKLKKHELLLSSDSVELLCGWVPEAKTGELEAMFDGYGCAYEFEDPSEDDDVPVLLKNNKFAQNFEWVLSLYSLPKYGSFDPTFIMGICYAFLFGLMFADAGYGLIMILVGFLVPKILNPSPWANGFFRSFGWCGIACVVMGILFGGYFGDFPIVFGRTFLGIDMPDSLALIKDFDGNVIDPVLNALAFMVVGIAVGVVHLIIGMIIKFNIVRKQESWVHAIFCVGAWWVLFAGIALLFLLPSVGPVVLGVGALGVFIGGMLNEKKWFVKPLKGLLAFYDIINYASDLLSYSRILALGLTSAVIAQVVNILGAMVGPSPLGFVVLVIAFVFGHALNIALNVMGTFVHSARLQYVEFFGKFFEDGGRAFDPLKSSSEYTNNK